MTRRTPQITVGWAVVAATLAVALAAGPGSSDWRYPQHVVKPRVSCESEGVFQHPRDCTWYYRCVSRMVPGYYYTYYFQCEPGTVFAPQLSQCVHGDATQCAPMGTTTPQAPITIPTTDVDITTTITTIPSTTDVDTITITETTTDAITTTETITTTDDDTITTTDYTTTTIETTATTDDDTSTTTDYTTTTIETTATTDGDTSTTTDVDNTAITTDVNIMTTTTTTDTDSTTDPTTTTIMDGSTTIPTTTDDDTTTITTITEGQTTTIATTDGDTTTTITTTTDDIATTDGNTTTTTTPIDDTTTIATTDGDTTTIATTDDDTTTIATTDGDTTTTTTDADTSTITTIDAADTTTDTAITTITTTEEYENNTCVSLVECEEYSMCQPSPHTLTLCRQCNTTTSLTQCPGDQMYASDTHLCVDPPPVSDQCFNDTVVVNFRYDITCSEENTTPSEPWILALYCKKFFFCNNGKFTMGKKLCTNYYKCQKEGQKWWSEQLTCASGELWSYDENSCVEEPKAESLCHLRKTNRLLQHSRKPRINTHVWNT